MNKDLRALLFKMAAVICIATGAFGVPAHAQVSPELANCEELRDSAASTQMASCNAHIGCNMVLKLKKTCANANGFLGKLKAMLADRREITNNDVFEANAPELMPVSVLRTEVAEVQRIVRNASKDPANGKRELTPASGNRIYYEGGLVNGNRHGVGVSIISNGGMDRGQFENGGLNGQGQFISANGTIYVGNYLAGQTYGAVFVQRPDGLVGIGGFEAGKNIGDWEYVKPSGVHYRVFWRVDGTESRGPDAQPLELAKAPPGSPQDDDPKVVGGSYRP